ncbi:MAG TPA: ATP-binding protein [Caldimonas sp.]|jgi:serine/threonine-protein kinase RsbW|nr:ATP-binding protein [Caldimonas sp.]HEX4234457.1 ATP-binding protein [Caldimonas sp.]
MTFDHVCTVRARMDDLTEAIAFVETFCDANAVARGDCLRVSLVVEELFTNTVAHGFGGGSDAPVRVWLRVDASELELSYEDSAAPFDPLTQVPRAAIEIEHAAPERPVGQLGIALVVSMASRIGYSREGDWNCLRVALQRQA